MKKSVSEKIEEMRKGPWLWFLTTVGSCFVAGFAGGFSSYAGLLAFTEMTHVSKTELDSLRQGNTELQAARGKLAQYEAQKEDHELMGTGGNTTNEIVLDPSPRNRTINISAEAEAKLSVKGTLQLQLLSGYSPSCRRNGSTYTRYEGDPESTTAQYFCRDQIPAGQRRTYQMHARDTGGTTRRIKMTLKWRD